MNIRGRGLVGLWQEQSECQGPWDTSLGATPARPYASVSAFHGPLMVAAAMMGPTLLPRAGPPRGAGQFQATERPKRLRLSQPPPSGLSLIPSQAGKGGEAGHWPACGPNHTGPLTCPHGDGGGSGSSRLLPARCPTSFLSCLISSKAHRFPSPPESALRAAAKPDHLSVLLSQTK